jgi:iron uptake system component EfeO
MSRSWRAGALLIVGLATFAVACSPSASERPASSAPASQAASAPAGSTTVNVVLTNAGCTPDVDSVPAGTITFEATNDGGDAVDEVELLAGEDVLAEAENLAPGLSGSFTVDLEPGGYILLCPGAETPETPFEVVEASS